MAEQSSSTRGTMIIEIGVALVVLFIVFRLRDRVHALEIQVAALTAASVTKSARTSPISAPIIPAQPRSDAPARAPMTPTPPMAPPPLIPASKSFPTPAVWEQLEHWLAERWIIAVGGATTALGGLFIVRYSIERGLLGPITRELLGAALGLSLITAAEWLRQDTLGRRGDDSGPLPQQAAAALSAAGFSTLYGVAYTSYALFGLLPAPITFGLLALIAAGAVLSGMRYGPLAAELGALMALVAPALVASTKPDAAILFTYLFFVTAGIFALIRLRPWPRLSGMVLAGNGLWQLVWVVSIGPQQAAPRAVHLLVIPALSAYFLLNRGWRTPPGPIWAWEWSQAPVPVWTAGLTTLGSFALLWILAASTGFDGVGALAWGIGLALLLGLVRWAPTQLPLLPVVALMTLGLVGSWAVPDMTPDPTMPWFLHGPLPFSTLEGYVTPAAVYAALFGIGGFLLLWDTDRPELWGPLSAAIPVMLLAVLYARLSAQAQSLPWATVALVLGALNLLAARSVARVPPRMDGALASYAASVTAALALAATMSLHTAWLTVALALELPALGLIWRRSAMAGSPLPGLRALAGIIATVLLVRLLFNPYLADYAGDMPIVLNWMIYGYGVSALASWIAARLLRPDTGEDWVTMVLESAALALGTALFTLELEHIAGGGGRLFDPNTPFRQAAAIANGWLAEALILLRFERSGSYLIRRWGWKLIGGAGLAWTLLVVVLAVNPLWNSYGVGATPILNLIIVAYGLPAVLLGLGAAELSRQGRARSAAAICATAVSLLIVTILMETRQAFHGDRLDLGGIEQIESYCYSFALLIVSLGLLMAGFRSSVLMLRHLGFGLLVLTLGKAFMIDMDKLTGLLRAASFLGVGLSLIAVGYAYQRLGRSGGRKFVDAHGSE